MGLAAAVMVRIVKCVQSACTHARAVRRGEISIQKERYVSQVYCDRYCDTMC